ATGNVGETIAGTLRAAPGRSAHLNIARAGPGKAGMDRREAALVEIGGVNLAAIFHGGGKRQRLAAGAGTKGDHLLAGLGIGQERSQLRALVLEFDLALDKDPPRPELPARRSR